MTFYSIQPWGQASKSFDWIGSKAHNRSFEGIRGLTRTLQGIHVGIKFSMGTRQAFGDFELLSSFSPF